MDNRKQRKKVINTDACVTVQLYAFPCELTSCPLRLLSENAANDIYTGLVFKIYISMRQKLFYTLICVCVCVCVCAEKKGSNSVMFLCFVFHSSI